MTRKIRRCAKRGALIDEDGQLEGAMPRGGTLPKQKDTTQILALPPNDDTTFVPRSEFPGS